MKKFLHAVWGTSALLLSSIILPSQANAQDVGAPFSEIGITLGPTNFLGDLGGNLGIGKPGLKDNNVEYTKFGYGLHFSHYFKDWLGVRFAANFGQLQGDDNIIDGKGGFEEARKGRNLRFKSNYQEAFLAAEIYPTVFLEEDPTDVWHKFRPYGIIGVGAFHFNPKATDDRGNWVELQPLRTEGQGSAEYPNRKPYKLIQMNIPMGVGLKYWVSDNTSLGLEIVHRKTFTDYIDDVSTDYVDPKVIRGIFSNDTKKADLAVKMADRSNGNPTYGAGQKRGTPNRNDSYYTVGIKLGFRLSSNNSFRNSTRCPVIRF